MIGKLLSRTKLSMKKKDYIGAEYFNTNAGSLQGGGINGVNFIMMFFENALKEIRHKRQGFKLGQEIFGMSAGETNPAESINTDKADFIEAESEHSKWTQDNSTSIFKKCNVHANPEETETTILKEMH